MIRYGLQGGATGGISFESIALAGNYIASDSKHRITVEKAVKSADWKSHATWSPVQAQITEEHTHSKYTEGEDYLYLVKGYSLF